METCSNKLKRSNSHVGVWALEGMIGSHFTAGPWENSSNNKRLNIWEKKKV